MTTVAGYHQHICTDGFDLRHFFSSVVYPFFVVPGCQGAAAAAATELMAPVGIKIDPVAVALIQDISGFLIIAVLEDLFTLSTVVARVVIYGQSVVTGSIQFYSAVMNVFDEKIENRQGTEPTDFFRKPFF